MHSTSILETGKVHDVRLNYKEWTPKCRVLPQKLQHYLLSVYFPTLLGTEKLSDCINISAITKLELTHVLLMAWKYRIALALVRTVTPNKRLCFTVVTL